MRIVESFDSAVDTRGTLELAAAQGQVILGFRGFSHSQLTKKTQIITARAPGRQRNMHKGMLSTHDSTSYAN